jgi:hypothetical protein
MQPAGARRKQNIDPWVLTFMKFKIRFLNLILILLLSLIILFSPVCALLRSCIVMLPYSRMHEKNSVLAKNQISFRIPGGLHTKKADWYPFVITFNDDKGLSSYLGEPVEFTVLYNFGHFQLREGTSSYYNPDSPYYSSFYGGYIVKPQDRDRRFGFLEDGSINTEELVKVPEFDQKYLVLPSLGCPREKRAFEERVTYIQDQIEYIGYSGWTRVDSEIETNSPAHEYRGFKQGYLQYGRPLGRFEYYEDFPVIDLKGRVYAKYFEEINATIVLYAMAPDWKVIDEVDREILSNARLSW